MNEFRMGLLKDRADKIRDDLTKARKTIEQAEAEGRELSDAERSFTEPTLKQARDIVDGMQKCRDEDADIKAINEAFAGVNGPLATGGGSGIGAKSGQRLSFKGLGFSGAKAMAGGDLGTQALAPSGDERKCPNGG